MQRADGRLPVTTDLWLLGLGQGRWSVGTDPDDGVRKATLVLTGARGLRRPGIRFDDVLPVTDLLARVRAALEAVR